MKVIFLDFDGVLNSDNTTNQWDGVVGFDDFRVGYVNDIIRATGAKVVISSAWRLHHSLEYLLMVLENYGFIGEVIDVTPRVIGGNRGREISVWLSRNPAVTNFVVLDDLHTLYDAAGKQIFTWTRAGLQRRDVARAVAILEQQ